MPRGGTCYIHVRLPSIRTNISSNIWPVPSPIFSDRLSESCFSPKELTSSPFLTIGAYISNPVHSLEDSKALSPFLFLILLNLAWIVPVPGPCPYKTLHPLTDSETLSKSVRLIMDRERGNSLPLPSTVTKFHRRNAISGPSSTFKALRTNSSPVSSQAVEEDEADLRLNNEERGRNEGLEVRDEGSDEQSESKKDRLWQSRKKLIMKRLIWVIMAVAIPIIIVYYLSFLRLLRSESAGIEPSQPGRTPCQEDCQASSGEAVRYQIVNHQSANSMDYLFCREGVKAGPQIAKTPRVPAEGNASFHCPSFGIRGTRAPSS